MLELSCSHGLTADGISGRAVRQYMLTNKLEQDCLATESPKWSITPLAR